MLHVSHDINKMILLHVEPCKLGSFFFSKQTVVEFILTGAAIFVNVRDVN